MLVVRVNSLIKLFHKLKGFSLQFHFSLELNNELCVIKIIIHLMSTGLNKISLHNKQQFINNLKNSTAKNGT